MDNKEIEAIPDHLSLPPPETRRVQSLLYSRLLEKTLTINILEQYVEYLDLDIRIICCDDCNSYIKLEPVKWLADQEAWLDLSPFEVARFTGLIQAGRCSCDVALNQSSANVQACRLSHLAAMRQDFLPVLLFLHKTGCDLDTITGTTHMAPLNVAIGFEQKDIVKFLLSINVNINVDASSGQISPLTTAIHFEREEIVTMLLSKTELDVNLCVDQWNQPLLINCVRLHPEFVQVLLEAGANPNVASKTGTTALMYAVNSRDVDLVKLLVRYGADVNQKNRQKENALVIVVYREDVQLVEILLEAGADPNYQTPVDQNSLLLLASYDGCVDIIRALIRYKAQVDLPNKILYTPLHIAAWDGHLECVKLLIQAGAPHDRRTQDGNTPLALAAHGNHLNVIQELLPLGCDVNNSDKDKDTPLQYAAYNGMTRAVELLIENGANPDTRNSVNATALWNAVYQKHKEVVKLLLIANVTMEVESVGINQHSHSDEVVHVYETPRSPLWVATEQNTPDIALLLITAGYNIHHEQWLLKEEFPPQAHNERLNNMLTQYAQNPNRLITICRDFFRQTFKLDIKTKVRYLDIPETLKNYLTLSDLKYNVECMK